MENRVLRFLPAGKKEKGDDVYEEGSIGKLKYRVFKRGVVHVFDKDFTFKKDVDLFEEEVKKLDLNNMKDGDEKRIKGSGDNDDLVFECKNDDIEIRLEKKHYSTVSKLKDLLLKGKRAKKVSEAA